MKKIKRNYLFIAILAIGIFVRLNNFDYPLVSEETNRDFLVARHIVKYHEMPVTGPNNGTLPLIGNSPSYNYFLSLLLFIHDDLMSLVFTNVILQITTVILLYLVIKEIFGLQTSLISAVFFNFATIFTAASVWPWQPYVMYFFLILALYLFFQFYFYKQLIYLLFSEIVFAFAISLHMSVVGLLPAYFLTIFYLLKKQRQKGYYFFLTIGVFCLSILVFYGSTFIHNTSSFNSNLVHPLLVDLNWRSLTGSFQQRADLLFEALSLNKLFLFLIFVFSPVYFFIQKGLKQKQFVLILFIWLISFWVVFSLVPGRFFNQHLYPALPFLVVILSEIFNTLLSASKPMKVFKVLIVVSLSLFLLRSSIGQINIFKFEKLKAINNITTELSEEILTIANKEKYDDLNFFKFKIYAPPENYWFEGNLKIADSVYWLNLEKKLNIKLVKVSDFGPESGFQILGDDRYIFLTCLYYKNESEESSDCLKRFAKDYPQYGIIRKLDPSYYGQSFYTSKKNF